MGLGSVLGSIAMFTVLASACALEQEHGYVQSSDGSLSFRHPIEWSTLDVDPISNEWVAAIDGADPSSDDHRTTIVLDAPFVVAHVYPLDESDRDTLSLGALRLLALADRRDPAAGDEPDIRIRFHDTIVDEYGFEGHHMRFEIDLETGRRLRSTSPFSILSAAESSKCWWCVRWHVSTPMPTRSTICVPR